VADLYADENVSARVIDRLRGEGHDILTALEDGRANQGLPDEDVLARATELERCVLTGNRNHFHWLHATNPNHSGILTFSDDIDKDALAVRIHTAIEDAVELKGKLIRVIRPSTGSR